MAGAGQHVAELEVPAGLIGQRRPPLVFMSAQQLFCWTVGTESPGRTGVREATVTARTANNSRAGSLITHTLAYSEIFERTGRVDASSQVCY
jgi:hypothetical protein